MSKKDAQERLAAAKAAQLEVEVMQKAMETWDALKKAGLHVPILDWLAHCGVSLPASARMVEPKSGAEPR